MSLNGLDSDAVTQAYQSAIAEAGGWYEMDSSQLHIDINLI